MAAPRRGQGPATVRAAEAFGVQPDDVVLPLQVAVCRSSALSFPRGLPNPIGGLGGLDRRRPRAEEVRSEEHTSELQSQSNFGCRLLLEKKKLQSSFQDYVTS